MASGGSGGFSPAPAIGTPTAFSSAPHGGWTYPQFPKAAYGSGNSYVAYVNGDTGGLYVGAWDGAAWSATLLDTPTPADDHNNPAVLVRDDGHILTAFCEHGGPNMFTMLSTDPGDISAFDAADNTSTGSSNYTYPALVQLTGVSGDPIYLMYRDITGAGATEVARFALSKSTDGGATWTTRTLVFTAANYELAYWTITADATTIHVMTTNRDPYGGDGTPVTVYHLYFDGTTETWHKSDGTEITATKPFALTEATVAYDGSDGVSFPIDALVVSGLPRFSLLVDIGGSRVSGRMYRWTGSAWTSVEVYEADHPTLDRYYGALVFNRANTSEAFAGIKDGTYTEIVRYLSPDGGDTWGAGTAVTSGSTEHQVAPIAVENGVAAMPVFWLHGTLISSTEFDFGISGLLR